jgi:hypothetical protein
MMDLNPNLHPLKLAAIIYRPADDVDGLLATFASDLICEGSRVGGIVQMNTKGASGTRELMEVIDLMTGAAIRICQPLGSGAGACKLDPAGLAEAATAVSRAVAANVDLVIVNKFSKQEASGGAARKSPMPLRPAGPFSRRCRTSAMTPGPPSPAASAPRSCASAVSSRIGGARYRCGKSAPGSRPISLARPLPLPPPMSAGHCRSARGHLPIITSDGLITADTVSPTLRPRSSTAWLVMDDVIIKPGASSILT